MGFTGYWRFHGDHLIIFPQPVIAL
jgi:hypothetical protein